jgi:hypothetical protein
MRNTTGLVVLSALWGLAGCSPPPAAAPAGADADFGGWSWDALKPVNGEADVAVSAAWGSRKSKFVYVILADAATTATTSIDTSGGRTLYVVALTPPKGRPATVRIETADGKTGGVAYAGQSFDLARGPVFVLLPRGETFEMRQLERDISDEPAGMAGVVRLVRNDPELARLFAKIHRQD